MPQVRDLAYVRNAGKLTPRKKSRIQRPRNSKVTVKQPHELIRPVITSILSEGYYTRVELIDSDTAIIR